MVDLGGLCFYGALEKWAELRIADKQLKNTLWKQAANTGWGGGGGGRGANNSAGVDVEIIPV